MKNLKKIIKPISNVIPAAKKMIPVIGNFLSTLDLVDNIVRLAKPFFDDARDKSLEESKKIYAYQINSDEYVTVYMKSVDIEVTSNSEKEAFSLFISKLSDLKEHRIISSNKKIQREQMKLIKKLDDISNSGEDFKKYLFRIIVEADDVREAKFKLPNINLFLNSTEKEDKKREKNSK